MNVLWLSHHVPYPPTGMGVLQRSYNLIRELAREHRVYLLALIQPRLLKDVLRDPVRGLDEGYAHLREFCAEVTFLSIPSEQATYGQQLLAAKSLLTRDPYSINWLKSAEMWDAARQWRDRYHFDLVHFDIIGLAHYLPLFSSYATTLDHHNIESHLMLRRAEGERNLLKRGYFWQEGVRLARYEARMCPKFDLHLTCSALDTTRLHERLPHLNVAEIPNGVDTSYFTADGREPEPNSLIFAGNLSWYPNAAAMLFFAEQVWPLLRAAIPDVTMHLVGANPPAKLTELATQDPRFKVHGFVPDVRVYLNRAAVYVCPIMDGGGTKLKVLDGLAMDKPMVAHPIACEGIQVIDGETVLFARTPEDYVKHISTLFRDSALRARMGAAARDFVERTYSYASIGRKLRQAMEECSKRKSQQKSRAAS